jgi:hypothetical protein
MKAGDETMIVRQFAPADLMMLALQPHQRALTAEVATPEYAGELAKHGASFTVADESGIVAVIGLIKQWDGCERAYAFLAETAGYHMLSITRKISDHLDKCGIRRIEAVVEEDFENGHRWVKLLGFHVEAPLMEKYWNDRNAVLYARIA